MKIDAKILPADPALTSVDPLKVVVVSQGDTSFPPGTEWRYMSARDVCVDKCIPHGGAVQLLLLDHFRRSTDFAPCFVLELGPGTPSEGLSLLRARLKDGSFIAVFPNRAPKPAGFWFRPTTGSQPEV